MTNTQANTIQIFITGEAGSGVKFMGKTLQKILNNRFYTHGINAYYSLIKGGRNYHTLVISTKPINSVFSKADIMYAQNKDTLQGYLYKLKKGGALILDTKLWNTLDQDFKHTLTKDFNVISVDGLQKLSEAQLTPVVANTVYIGVICALLGLRHKGCSNILNSVLKDIPEHLKDQNQKALKLGFELIKQNRVDKRVGQAHTKAPLKAPKPIRKRKPSVLVNAAFTTAKGFIKAKGKVFVAYPMTPATPILHYLAKWAEKEDIVVHQASSEIEAIGAVLGANWAGVRAATATSGGGLDLMGEFISMAGMAEIPGLIIDAQRVGPSTGLPTWQEQSDLNLAKHIGHGEFLRIVLSAYDPEHAYQLIGTALNLADIYQTPVILLLDKLLTTSLFETDPQAFTSKLPIDRGKLDTNPKLDKTGFYPRYAFSVDGISPRPLIGKKGAIHVTNSDEHNIYGFSLESDPERVLQHSKRLLKPQTFLKNHWQPPFQYNPKQSKTALITWGSTYHTVQDAIRILSQKYKKNFAHIHFVYMHPLDQNRLKRMLSKYARVILVENNATAQLEDTMQALQIPVYKKLLKFDFDGEPFYTDEIVQALSKIKCL